MSKEIELEIDKVLLNESVDRHSFFQLKYFVIGKEPTTQSKLWRCVKELETRKNSIDAINLEIQDLNDKLEIIDIESKKASIQLEKTSDELDKRLLEIAIKRSERNKKATLTSIAAMNKKLKNTEDEAIFFARAFKSLEEIEKIKPFDDLESQQAYWNERLGQEANLKIMLNGLPLDTELAKAILAMNDNMPVKKELNKLIEDTQKKMLENK